MSDQFHVTIVGNADEDTRLRLLGDLTDIAQRYREAITTFNAVDVPPPVSMSIRQPTDTEQAVADQERAEDQARRDAQEQARIDASEQDQP